MQALVRSLDWEVRHCTRTSSAIDVGTINWRIDYWAAVRGRPHRPEGHPQISPRVATEVLIVRESAQSADVLEQRLQ